LAENCTVNEKCKEEEQKERRFSKLVFHFNLLLLNDRYCSLRLN